MRNLVIEEILKAHFEDAPANTKEIFRESLKYMSDLNLLAFAIQIGIDTDALLAAGVRS